MNTWFAAVSNWCDHHEGLGTWSQGVLTVAAIWFAMIQIADTRNARNKRERAAILAIREIVLEGYDTLKASISQPEGLNDQGRAKLRSVERELSDAPMLDMPEWRVYSAARAAGRAIETVLQTETAEALRGALAVTRTCAESLYEARILRFPFLTRMRIRAMLKLTGTRG